MYNDPLELLKRVQPNAFGHNSVKENATSAQAQQNSPLKEKMLAEQTQQNSPLSSDLQAQKLEELKKNQEITKTQQIKQSPNDTVVKGNYTPSLCISKKEYESIVNKRPLIKFRPLRNSFIKSSDKNLLAQSLGIPVSDVDTVIKQTINYLTYMNPNSIYYDPSKMKDEMYMAEDFKKTMLEKQMLYSTDAEAQEYLYYKEQGDLIGPYVYRHGSKDELLGYMKYQLSEAKSALKQLYNIVDNEAGGLYSYFERPIHMLDNRSVIKMQKIIKTGLSEAKNQGYLTQDMYDQNVDWALQKIYAIQSNTSLREALRVVARNS